MKMFILVVVILISGCLLDPAYERSVHQRDIDMLNARAQAVISTKCDMTKSKPWKPIPVAEGSGRRVTEVRYGCVAKDGGRLLMYFDGIGSLTDSYYYPQ